MTQAKEAPTALPAFSTTPESALLRVQELVKTFGNRTVVDGVSYFMQPGEIVGLLGANGAGKTTTFRMTIGMIRPDSGTVFFRDQDITRLPVYQRARRGIGYLSQEQSVFQQLTVENNLFAILESLSLGSAERRERCDRLLEEFGLTHIRSNLAGRCSGGEKRRLEIARALITDPRLLMLDEPFSGVDPLAVEEIQKIIRALRVRGIAILLTDHNVRETLSVSDRAYIIAEGRILAHGVPAELIDNPVVRKVYLGEHFRI
ncbi:MAG: LPS export ABC transporter ATP-binding protein [Candidatus Brocadiae bacterium]|nr:LPS export ABC transporter ATP-binding protein [Candidatus Brocadiia bacterium]